MKALKYVWDHPLLLLLVALFLGAGIGWLLTRTGPEAQPELTTAQRKHLERQAVTLATEGATHYSTAQDLLYDPIIAGDSARRLAAFDSTVRSW